MTIELVKKKYMLTIIKISLLFVIFFLLFSISSKNYLVFHTVIELFSISIGFGICLIAINSFTYYKNIFFASLAISFFFIGIIEVIHTLLYVEWTFNMINCQNVYIQLSLSAKYMRIISFIIALYCMKKKPSLKIIFFLYMIFTASVLLSIFNFSVFPTCYVKFSGVTDFKIASNFILVFLSCYALVILKKNKKCFKINSYRLLILYLIFLALSDVVYIVYIKDFNFSQLISHFFKFISFCMLYSVVIKITLRDPYNSIFQELSKKALELKIVNETLSNKNSELKKAKINIAKSKAKYKKVLELLPEAVLVREDSNVIYANSAFIKLFKFNSKEEIINKPIRAIAPKEGKKTLERKILESNNSSFVPFKRETLFCADGQPVETEVSSVSIDFHHQKHVIAIIRNIEERHQYERLRMELEEKDNLRIEFFANICHELRTPINVIYSALQLQDIYMKQNNIELMTKYNNISKQNCYRLLKLCNNLIDINKLDSGFITPNMKVCNVVEVVESLTSSVIPYVKSKNLNIIFDTNTEEKYIKCDFNFMERIILNLLSNAIKFSRENGCIWVNVWGTENEVFIIVKDNGVGIPENKQKIIFERFMQADKSFSRSCEGSGIGLSLVKSFVEIQGGTIECKSIQEKETQFIIRFPVDKALEESALSLEESEFSSYKIGNSICVEFSDIYFY